MVLTAQPKRLFIPPDSTHGNGKYRIHGEVPSPSNVRRFYYTHALTLTLVAFLIGVLHALVTKGGV